MERLLSGFISLFTNGFRFASFFGSCPLNAMSFCAQSTKPKNWETIKITIPRIRITGCYNVGFKATFRRIRGCKKGKMERKHKGSVEGRDCQYHIIKALGAGH